MRRVEKCLRYSHVCKSRVLLDKTIRANRGTRDLTLQMSLDNVMWKLVIWGVLMD